MSNSLQSKSSHVGNLCTVEKKPHNNHVATYIQLPSATAPVLRAEVFLLLAAAVLGVPHLYLLRYSPQYKSCWSCTDNCYTTSISFFSPLFLYFFILEFRNLLLSVPSVLNCFLFWSLSCPSFILFYSSFYSLLCLLPLYNHCIFSPPLLFSFQICYPFLSLFLLLYTVCFSLILYSFTIQSVLFLLVFIFLDPSN